MKKVLFFVISAIIGIALFIGVIWHIGFNNIWQTLHYFSFNKWLIILFFNAFQLVLSLLRWKLILKSQGYDLPIRKLVSSKLAGFSVDYTTPSPNIGGEAIRAYILKKDTGVGFSQGLASIIIDKLMDFSYALPFLLFSIFYALVKFSLSWKIIISLLLISGIFIFLITLFYYKTLRRKEFFGSIIRFLKLNRLSFINRMTRKIAQFEQIIIEFFQRDKKTFYQGLGISLLGGVFSLGGLWLTLSFLGLDANVLQIILIATLTIITFLLPIPGSFGSTETGEVIIFSLLGFRPEQAVAFTLIFRSIDFLKVALGFLFIYHFGLKIGRAIINGKNISSAKMNENETNPSINFP